MNKVIKRGKVAVLISGGFGAGWSTWIHDDKILFDPVIVDAVQKKLPFSDVESYLKKEYPNKSFHGYNKLCIVWVKVGDRFRINEYDGSEDLILEKDEYWITA